MNPRKKDMKAFLKAMGRMQEEDYVTADEFYKMFNAVVEAVKQSSVNNQGKITEIEKVADKKAKELEKLFGTLLTAVDEKMSDVKDGEKGKDGETPIAGVDYPDYQEIRDFIKEQVEDLPQPDDINEALTADMIKDRLMALEGNDRLPHTAINGIEDFVDERMRLMESTWNTSPKFVGGGSGSGGASSLSELTDVTLSSPSNGELLQYNGSAWVNTTVAGSGDVTAASNFGTDNVLVRSDGTSKGVQATGITVADTTDAMSGMGSITIDASGSLAIGAATILSDSAGTTTLNNIDALDATTEATIEAAIDTLSNLTSAPSLSITESQISDLGSYQPLDAQLTSLAGLVPGIEGRIIESDGLGGFAMVNASTFISDNNILDTADIGVSVQAYDADLTTWAGVTPGTGVTTALGNAVDGAGGLQSVLSEGAFIDGDKTKLDGIEAGADVTDTANVTSAGALMDSELTDITAVKALADASISDVDTGTSTTAFVTPDALAGSDLMIKYVQVVCFDYTTDTATGDGKGYFHIPAGLGGMNLVEVHAEVITAGTTGTTDIQIHNVTQAADMLTTKITIDSGETGSDTAATAAVIDTANDDVATNDLIRIDVDAVSTTAAQGLIVTLGFQLP